MRTASQNEKSSGERARQEVGSAGKDNERRESGENELVFRSSGPFPPPPRSAPAKTRSRRVPARPKTVLAGGGEKGQGECGKPPRSPSTLDDPRALFASLHLHLRCFAGVVRKGVVIGHW